MPRSVGYPAEVKGSDADLVRAARTRLELGRRFREQNREQTWRQSEQQYAGKHWPRGSDDDPTADLVVVNVSFSTINTIVPYITSEEPKFLVHPYSYDATVKNARLQQAFLNKLWQANATNAQEALEVAAVDYLIYGDGYMKASYEIEERQTDYGVFTDVAVLHVDRVSPWDVWIDPTATSFGDARWVAQRIYMTRSEVEADDRFKLKDELSYGTLDWSAADDGSVEPTYRTTGDPENEWVVLYEFYDLADGTMITFADGGDMPLRKLEGTELMLVQMGNYRLPRSPYHMGELEQIWGIQQELNKTRSQLMTHRRRNIPKHFIKENALTEEGKAALMSPIVNELVPVQGDQPLSDIVQSIQLSGLSADAYAAADSSIRDIYEITGVNEYLRGATPEIRRTATEASIIEGASNIKTRAKLAAVERATRKVGTLVLAIARDVFPETDYDEVGLFLTGREAEELNRLQAGEDIGSAYDQGATPQDLADLVSSAELGGDAVVTPTPDMFVGEYEVEVEQHSTELRNPIVREQKFREMAMALSQMAPQLTQLGVQINLRKVFEMWFEAAGVVDVDGMFSGQPSAPLGMPAGPGVPPGAPPGVEPQPGQPAPQSSAPPSQMIDAASSGMFPPA